MQQQINSRKAVTSWTLYDWANSAFATTVMAGFFPIFFKEYWSVGTDTNTSTFLLGMANSVGSIIVAMLAPILGSIADQSTSKKKFLMAFAYLGILATICLFWVGKGNWQAAAFLYVLGAIGFSGGNIFYDSLITGVASKDRLDKISALGFGMGYLGGGVLFALNVLMVLKPDVFGFADAGQAVRFSFLSVGIWWAIFSIPIMLFVKEPENARAKSGMSYAKAGFVQFKGIFKEARALKTVFLFLIAYWLYIDGVDTIVRMAVDYGISLGFDSNDLIVALLITQFVGFPSAIFFGWLGGKIGAKRAIFIAIGVYLFVTIWGAFIGNKMEFYALAIIIGLVQGGIQALSRSYYAKIIPISRSGEFFGLYNMLGKFAAVIGPVLMGGVGLLMRNMGFTADFSSRASITSIALLFIAGGILLYRVDAERARAEVAAVYGEAELVQ